MATAQAKTPRVPRVPLMNVPPAESEPVSPFVPTTPDLDAAVLRVQADAAKLSRNAQGQIQSRMYTYVTLTAVNDEVLPLLVAEQLVWKTWPTVLENGTPGLRYRMTHVATGQFDEDVMPLPCDPTMQGLGSAITYGRRYALVSYLNLTIDEDDDGAGANTPGGGSRYSEATTAPQGTDAGPTARQPQQTERHASPAQVKMLRGKSTSAKLSKVRFANEVKGALGEAASTSTDNAAAERWLKKNLDRLPARLVDDVIARIAHAGAEGSQA